MHCDEESIRFEYRTYNFFRIDLSMTVKSSAEYIYHIGLKLPAALPNSIPITISAKYAFFLNNAPSLSRFILMVFCVKAVSLCLE